MEAFAQTIAQSTAAGALVLSMWLPMLYFFVGRPLVKAVQRIAHAAEVQAGIAEKEKKPAEKEPLMNIRSSGAGIGPDFGPNRR